MLGVVREVTGEASEVGGETPLMEVGVDSLGAAELASRLRAWSGVALSATLMFEQPTPRAIATHLLATISLLDPTSGSPEYTEPIFSPYILDTLAHPEEYWYAVSMDLAAAEWWFEMHSSLRTRVILDSRHRWCWNGQREAGDLPQFDEPRAPTDLSHLVYFCSCEKTLHVHHLVFDGVSVYFLSEQAGTAHVAESDVAVLADYSRYKTPELLEHVHRVVSSCLFTN